MYRTGILAAALLSNAACSAAPMELESPNLIMLAQAGASPGSDGTDAQRAPTDEESLALAALEGLMLQPEERALPILKKVLGGSQSVLVKQRALFVLSQVDASEAQTLLVDTARSSDPVLRAEAIRDIGISGNPKSLPVLQQIYERADAKVKQQVLEAWLISDSKNEVFQAAINAKSEEDANEAIRILSAMGARDELRKVGEARKPNRSLVEAYAVAGDLASLRKIVASNGEISARRDAVRDIGIIDSDEARTALRQIYSSSQETEIREAALQGMVVCNDEQGVMALYRASKNAEEKRMLLRTLSAMDGDVALKAIDAALENKK